MSELLDSNRSDSIETQIKNINLELAKAQLAKLNLEIENLKPRRRWHEGIVRYIPVITAVLSIAGFLWGVYLFRNQQERDRQTREEDRISRDQMQYRASYEQLLQFSSNPNMTAQRVVFLRDDIDQIIDSLYPPEKDPTTMERNKSEKAQLKKRILDLIRTECDFTQTRHVQLDIAALKNWMDYEEDLKTFHDKYIHAIRSLYVRDPKYIEAVTYNPKIGYFQVPSDPLYNSFGILVEGFRLHVKLLGEEEKKKAIEDFTVVTNNPTLTADLFPPDSTGPGQ